MEKLISIIVPVYNVEDYLDRCITSLVKQTYSNIEIILVNDGSTDRSLEIIEAWQTRDTRIRIIDKKNGGLSDARNAGIRIAKGDYFCFVDSDDYISPNMVSHLYNLCSMYDVQMAGCGYKDFTDGITLQDTFDEANARVEMISFQDYMEKYMGDEKVKMVTAWAKLYEKNLFDDIFYPLGRIHEDEFVTYKLAFNAKKMAFSDAPYYYYYHRDGSIMSNRIIRSYYDTLEAYCERDSFFGDNEICINGWNKWLMDGAFVPCLECVIADYNSQNAIQMYRRLFKKYGLKAISSVKELMLLFLYRTTGALFKLKRYMKRVANEYRF